MASPSGIGRCHRLWVRCASISPGTTMVTGIVAILCAVVEDGLEAVEAACAEALAAKLCSHDVVLNILARRREPERPAPIATPASLTLGLEPQADCARYDALRATGVS